MTTDLHIVIKSAKSPHQRDFNRRFSIGLKRHSQKFSYANNYDFPACDLAVFWSHRPKDIIDQQRSTGKDYLVAERGYVGDRFAWTSLGYNGLNGRAEFDNEDKDSARWDKYFRGLMKGWHYNGHYVLILGQVDGDSSLSGMNEDYNQWLKKLHERCQELYCNFIMYRPHPLARRCAPEGLRLTSGTLEEDLADAIVAVTYNSNSGVDAVMSGTSTVTLDRGSMAWPVASHGLDLMCFPDRTKWANEIAWCQWSDAEIINGDAWEHLKQRYE